MVNEGRFKIGGNFLKIGGLYLRIGPAPGGGGPGPLAWSGGVRGYNATVKLSSGIYVSTGTSINVGNPSDSSALLVVGVGNDSGLIAVPYISGSDVSTTLLLTLSGMSGSESFHSTTTIKVWLVEKSGPSPSWTVNGGSTAWPGHGASAVLKFFANQDIPNGVTVTVDSNDASAADDYPAWDVTVSPGSVSVPSADSKDWIVRLSISGGNAGDDSHSVESSFDGDTLTGFDWLHAKNGVTATPFTLASHHVRTDTWPNTEASYFWSGHAAIRIRLNDP